MSAPAEPPVPPPLPLEARAPDLSLAVEPATFLAVLEAGAPPPPEECHD